jgi:outer membrane receptor protein involved in Fe transport
MADALLGNFSTYTEANTNREGWYRFTQAEFYFQDDWRVSPKLTVNLGLRWSHESPFQTKYGQQSQFDPAATDPLTGRQGAIVHNPGPLARGDWNNFQPPFLPESLRK